MVQPLGPIQCGRCSGLVNASKTSRRGASTTRVTTTSRSDGVVNVVAPTSCAVAMIPLPLLEVLYVLIQSFEALVPKAAIALGPLDDLPQRRRLEPAGAPLCLAAARDEAGVLEHPEVLGDRGAAHRERRRELLDRGRTGGEAREDRAPRRVGQGGEGGAQGVRCHVSNPSVS